MANSTMNATAGTIAPDDGSTSALCMSCHDGTVGIGSMQNESNQGGGPTNDTTMITGNANLGTSLSNDHPVNFVYDTDLANADGELADPADVGFPAALELFGGELQCATCHDPHSDTNYAFLTVSNAGSALCDSCHNK